jgi:hypothetical protein
MGVVEEAGGGTVEEADRDTVCRVGARGLRRSRKRTHTRESPVEGQI